MAHDIAWEVRSTPMSFAAFEALPDTHHTEYVDGAALMNPPTRFHVKVARRLTRLLEDACPEGFEVLPEAGWLIAPHTVFVPDIMLARVDAPGADILREAPLLAVEIMSPSTRDTDRTRKRTAYAAAGAQYYWLVDPLAFTVTTMRSAGGTFTDEQLMGEERFYELTEPVRLTLDLTDLFAE